MPVRTQSSDHPPEALGQEPSRDEIAVATRVLNYSGKFVTYLLVQVRTAMAQGGVQYRLEITPEILNLLALTAAVQDVIGQPLDEDDPDGPTLASILDVKGGAKALNDLLKST